MNSYAEGEQNGKNSKSLIYTSLGHFVNDGGFFIVPVLIAIFTDGKLVSALALILFPVVYYSSSVIFGMMIAKMADESEKKGQIISVGLILISLGLIGFALTLEYKFSPFVNEFFLLSALVTGLGTAFYHPIGASILQSSYRGKKTGKALGINGAFGSFGRALYPSVLVILALTIDYSSSVIVLAAIGIIAATIIGAGLRRTPPKLERPKVNHNSSLTARSSISLALILLAVIAFTNSFAIQGIAAWLPTYLALQTGAGVSVSLGLRLTGMYSAAIIGQPVWGFLVDRFNRRAILAMAMVGSALSILGFILTVGITNLVFIELMGFFTFSGFPLFLSLASDYTPGGSSALSNALVFTLGANSGGVVGAEIVGTLVFSGLASWSSTFILMTIVSFVAAILIIFLGNPRTKAENDQIYPAGGK